MKQITIAGNVAKEGVSRRTQAGEPVMGFSVAVNDMRTKKALFFDCSMWGKRGDAIAKFIQKGTKVVVSGDLGIREHEGRTYLTINANEVTLMGDGKKKDDDTMTAHNGEVYDRKDVMSHVKESRKSFHEDLDDDLPF